MARQLMDISLTEHKTLLIRNGDFVITESTGEHQTQLILNNKGDFKQSPTVCVGANTYIDDEGPANIIRAITQQFMQDGMEVKNLLPNTGSAGDSTESPFINAFYQ
jgi:hypothetical protein